MGNFKPTRKLEGPKVDVSNFVATAPDKIKIGDNVIHHKFGQGKVMNIDESKIATIFFPEATDTKEKRIVLQFSKLMVVE